MLLFTTEPCNLQSPTIGNQNVADAVTCEVGLRISVATESRFMRLVMVIDFEK
jgi:hypothetical protein